MTAARDKLAKLLTGMLGADAAPLVADAILAAGFVHLGAPIEDGAAPLPFDRDELGRMVREAWVRWAETQPNPKPTWLVPYEALSEPDKEADRQIGEAIARWTMIGCAARHSIGAPTEDATTTSHEKAISDLLIASAPYADMDETGRLPSARAAADRLLTAPDLRGKQRYANHDEELIGSLVERFADALSSKLRKAEEKYQYRGAWRRDDWHDALVRQIRRHMDKGDPLDVAAYCAFAWHHGWTLARP